MRDKFKIFTKLLLIATSIIFSFGVEAQSDCKKLFNGKNLSGWEIKNGTAWEKVK